MNLPKIIFSSFAACIPLQNIGVFASELYIANNPDELEEIKIKKVNKNGDLIVKFCSELTDYSGYVEVQNNKFLVSEADVVKDKKIVWKDTNLSKTKGDSIKTNNLLSQDKVVINGDCDGVGILPLIILGGIAIGAGGGGSSSSSSN